MLSEAVMVRPMMNSFHTKMKTTTAAAASPGCVRGAMTR